MSRAATEPAGTWFLQDARSYVVPDPDESHARRAFHERLPGYGVSPLVPGDPLAERLGLGRLWVKDESSRYGLPSFKILGASWATYRALRDLGGFRDADWDTVDELARLVAARTAIRRLAAATDGNHGRAVARMARWLGLGCSIFVPRGTAAARIDAIEGEGATVIVVDGGYGDAVARSADEASGECLVVSDTSWPGYEDIPRWVIEGYRTIFDEVDDQLSRRGEPRLDIVVVQAGVGALTAAATRHYRSGRRTPEPRLIAVEPTHAACVLASVSAGHLVTIPGPHESIMAGLNCDTPSLVAWPDLSRGVDLFLAVDDRAAERAMRDLAEISVVAGETGAAGLAGLTDLCVGGAQAIRAELALPDSPAALVLSTEGATDPDAYAAIVGGGTT